MIVYRYIKLFSRCVHKIKHTSMIAAVSNSIKQETGRQESIRSLFMEKNPKNTFDMIFCKYLKWQVDRSLYFLNNKKFHISTYILKY